jgi:hypothetical protein
MKAGADDPVKAAQVQQFDILVIGLRRIELTPIGRPVHRYLN